MILPELYALCEQYHNIANFAMVYILEAHATNEWPINNLPEGIESLNQHITLQDRQNAVQLFIHHYSNIIHDKMKIVLDNSDNEFNSQYPSWPFRVWILNDEKEIVFKGMANANSGYHVNLLDVKYWLQILTHHQQSKVLEMNNSAHY